MKHHKINNAQVTCIEGQRGLSHLAHSPQGGLLFENCITKKELALHLKISEGLITKLMYEDGLPHLKLGRAVRFQLNGVYSWFQQKGMKL